MSLKVKREYKKNHRWAEHYNSAKQRCTNPNKHNYKYYGGAGIKFLMTMVEVQTLWFRDKAYLLRVPSLDRIKSDGNYTYDNCRFIEHHLNSGAKLNEEQVRYIRKMKGIKMPKELSEALGISRSTVWHIQAKKSWKYLL